MGRACRGWVMILLRKLWIENQKEEELEDLNSDGSMEYWRI
jgi:hypothetical protein